MNVRYRMLGLLLVASVSAWGLAGCGGAECGEGTTERDGTCMPEVTCGGGTKAQEGQCIVGDDGCESGTTYDAESGTCVVSGAGACAEGTEFDAESNTCVAVITECGPNTKMEEGTCVPELDSLCDGMGAVKAQDGKCVVAEAACSGNTQLSAMGNCVVADGACGAGLTLNDDGQCAATEDVCGDKTSFDEDMGLCVPDETCQMGDTVVDGVCVSPAEALAKKSDAVSESENNDPNLGGTANDLTVKPVGEQTVFTGVIEAPRTIDGSSDNKQDVDGFKFSAEAGDWFKVSVQSLGLPAPMILVTGPNSFMRMSPTGRPALTETEMKTDDAGRKLVLPYKGDYTIHVLPTAQATDSTLGPAGSSDWKYVGSLEKIDSEMPTAQNLSMTPLTGSFGQPKPNFYKVSGFSSGELVEFSFDSVGDDVEGLLEVWKDPTTLVGTFDVEGGETTAVPLPMLNNDEFFVLLDWKSLSGSSADYEISASAVQNQENLGAIAADMSVTSMKTSVKEDEHYYYTFSAQAGQVLEIINENKEDEEIGYTVTDSSGNELASEDDMEAPVDRDSELGTNDGYAWLKDGGTYLLRITAEDGDHTEQTVTLKSHTPEDLGTAKVGESVSKTVPQMMGNVVGAEGRAVFYKVELTEEVRFDGTLSPLTPKGADVGFALHKEPEIASSVFEESAAGGTIDVATERVAPGTYLFRISFAEDVKSYEFSVDFKMPPVVESEPNNIDSNATTLPIGSQFRGDSQMGDKDVYKFELTSDMASDEMLLVGAEEPGAYWIPSYTTDCKVRDDMGNTLESSSYKESGCSFIMTGLTKGTYYFDVTINESSAEDYEGEIFVSTDIAEVEPNDSFGKATPITVGETGYGILPGTGMNSETADYWKIDITQQLPSDEMLRVTVSDKFWPADNEMDVKLYESDQMTEIDLVTFGGLDYELESAKGLAAGTYFLEVKEDYKSGSYEGSLVGRYSVQVESVK